MKIVGAEVFVTCPGRNFVTLKITTEDGITGLGDATLNGRELPVASYLTDHLCPQLIGRDARRIEDIWQFFYKGAYWRRGPVTMSAISAVDMALWDIKAKAANMPLYQLLGGASREGVMVYCHTTGHTIDDVLEDYVRHKEQGFKAIRVQCGVPGMKTTYGMAKVFHEIFFPEQSAAMALILAMGTYGAGYIARIIGAFVFGKMGDRIGRKKVLFITITMMGICTTLIGVLPTYAQIGIFAPVLLVTLRIIQGLGAGAEISGAGTMLAEYAPKGKRGIISSLVAMGTNCGTLSATAIWAVMFFALEREQLIAWGWRIPFLASVVVMIFAIWLRMNLKESPVFEKVSEGEKSPALTSASENTLGAMFTSKSFWLATGLRFGQAGNSGLIQTFLAGYLVQTL